MRTPCRLMSSSAVRSMATAGLPWPARPSAAWSWSRIVLSLVSPWNVWPDLAHGRVILDGAGL
jgi:hypothetical protein